MLVEDQVQCNSDALNKIMMGTVAGVLAYALWASLVKTGYDQPIRSGVRRRVFGG